MMIMIDNYDSFTYNLVQYLGEMGEELKVARNNQISIAEIDALNPGFLMISPGPCTPNEAGVSMEAIRHFSGRVPVFGVCLGHQAIAQVFGGEVIQAGRLMHGKTSMVYHDGKTIFEGIANPFPAARYHSLIVKRETLPDELEISAWTEEGEIMALRHKELAVEGVQFHPESILTVPGKQLLRNFIRLYSLQAQLL